MNASWKFQPIRGFMARHGIEAKVTGCGGHVGGTWNETCQHAVARIQGKSGRRSLKIQRKAILVQPSWERGSIVV